MTKQWERVFIALIYFIILTGILWVFMENPFKDFFSKAPYLSIIYITGALLLLLGKYLVEPYFTKPTDAIVNSISVLLSLNSIINKNDFLFFWIIFYFSFTILLLSFISIFTKDFNIKIINNISRFCCSIAVTFGQSKVIFSIIYLSAVYTYFLTDTKNKSIALFSFLLLYWILVVFFDLITILWIKSRTLIEKLINRKYSQEIGYAIGCENPSLYKIECDTENFDEQRFKENLILIETSNNSGQLGIIIGVEHLLGKRWFTVYLLKNKNNNYFYFSLSKYLLFNSKKSIFDIKKNKAFLMELENIQIKDEISKCYFYKNKDNFIGYITTESDIYTINITILSNNLDILTKITDGAIIKCLINGSEVQYQIINGKTKKEHLENHDSFGYTIAIARKLGGYDKIKQELKQAKWMPEIYTPVFIYQQQLINENELQEIADKAIGRLPNTNLSIPIKNYNDLVTHNTAILGILGIGKSCLTYELIKKLLSSDIKIICIDITNEYIKELPNYIKYEIISHDNENAFNQINDKYEYIHLERDPASNSSTKNPEKSGNMFDYREEIEKDLYDFIFGCETIPENVTFNNNKKIRIYNPDYHKVSKGEKIGYNVYTTELTQAEKTRIIVERIFSILMKMGVSPDKKARILIIFEEAHSLIPEWNSVSNEGDKTATNGTAKIILQGRKYGLGCFVITQRTANVSKSILNQCNTIFAMRVFDDTGKGFLENYIGTDYTNTLPTLEERNAIVIGKGLQLKQPVIIELNDREYLLKHEADNSKKEPHNTTLEQF